MMYIHELTFAAFVLLIAVNFTTSCQSESFDTEKELSVSISDWSKVTDWDIDGDL